MGGVIAREVVVGQMGAGMREKLRGVVFIASPLQGSRMEEEVKGVFGEEVVGYFNNFGGVIPWSISKEEFSQHFYDSGFERSRTSKEVSEATDFQSKNQRFLDLKVPHLIFTESKKTMLPVVGLSFWFVRPEMALLNEDSQSVSIEEKDHNQV